MLGYFFETIRTNVRILFEGLDIIIVYTYEYSKLRLCYNGGSRMAYDNKCI